MFREKERILMNTFDFWKAKFDQDNKTDSVKTRESIYACDECVYEASTVSDLKEHKKVNHTSQQFTCDKCGHVVLTEKDLAGHMQAYHETMTEKDDVKMVYLCNDCDDEFDTKSEVDEHIKNSHTVAADFNCDKCDFIGKSIDNLEDHRREKHFYFKYYCSACNFSITNKELLKEHKQNNHNGMAVQTKREKLAPPPKCNPIDVNHSSECCDRDPRNKKAIIYSNKQREYNGICIDWNKGYCANLDLCKFFHIEIEACRFATFCSRNNCTYWHNLPLKFPFLEETSRQKSNC